MIAFIDSSVILRKLFGEPNPVEAWSTIEEAYASRVLAIEVSRTIDRCRLDGRIDDEQVAVLHEELEKLLRSMNVVALTESVLERAAGAMPSVVGTLDAIHLATALEVNRALEAPLVLLTHDRQLGRAARASGLAVNGV